MKKRWHVLLAFGLMLGLIVGVIGPAAAVEPYDPGYPPDTANGEDYYDDDDPFDDSLYGDRPEYVKTCDIWGAVLGGGFIEIPGTDICIWVGSRFFPWTADIDDRPQLDPRTETEFGSLRGVIDLQNLEEDEVEVDIYVGQPGGGWALSGGYTVGGGVAVTIDPAEILGDQESAPVIATGWKDRGEPEPEGRFEARCFVMIGGKPHDVTRAVESLPGDPLENCREFALLLGEQADLDENGDPIFWVESVPAWLLDNPPEPARLAGTHRQAAGPPLEDGKTTADHSMVDGYGAFNFDDIFSPHNGYVVPIVQTNNGWNTMLQVASFARFGDSVRYTIEIFEAFDGSGERVAEIEGEIQSGEVDSHNILEHPDIDDGFVGSAVIRSEAPIGAVAERVKVETEMLIMTTSQAISDDEGPTVAPLVYLDFHNWNTGISVFNLDGEEDLTATIDFAPPTMAFPNEITAPPMGMGFAHKPGTADESGGLHGAIVSGTTAHVAEIDQVKYADSGPGTGAMDDAGNAMSYRTIPLADLATDGDRLAQPLFQKGDPETGLGDTSGIQFFNTSPDDDATLDIWIYDEDGSPAPPTMDGPISQTLMPHESYTFYAFGIPELPAGFKGSVQVDVSGDGQIAAVGNTVNYAVPGDGAFSNVLYNVSATAATPVPTSFLVYPGYDENPVGSTHQIFVTVWDQFAERYSSAAVYAKVDTSTADNQGRLLHPYPAYTNANGIAELSYTSQHVGLDAIVVVVDRIEGSKTVEKRWVPSLEEGTSLTLEHALGSVVDGGGVAYTEAGDSHTVIATLVNEVGNPVPGVDVHFSVSGGHANAATDGYVHQPASHPSTGSQGPNGTTNAQGQVALTYTGTATGTDNITVQAEGTGSASVASVWVNEIALTLDPKESENPAGTDHSVTAKATADGAPLVEIVVIFEVEGTNEGATGTTSPDAEGENTGKTDADGEVTFTYTDTEDVFISCDDIRAWFLGFDQKYWDLAVKCWEEVSP